VDVKSNDSAGPPHPGFWNRAVSVLAPILIVVGIVVLVFALRALGYLFGDKVVSTGFLFVIFGIPGFGFGKGAVETFKPTRLRGKIACYALGIIGTYTGLFLFGLIAVTTLHDYQRMRETGDFTVPLVVLAAAAVGFLFWLTAQILSAIKNWLTDILAEAIRRSRN
jgi:hypothetical protein